MCHRKKCPVSNVVLSHTKKKHGLYMGNGVGCPWAAHGNFAMQIRLPTTAIYGISGQLSRQPTASKYDKKWAAQLAAE